VTDDLIESVIVGHAFTFELVAPAGLVTDYARNPRHLIGELRDNAAGTYRLVISSFFGVLFEQRGKLEETVSSLSAGELGPGTAVGFACGFDDMVYVLCSANGLFVCDQGVIFRVED
jgi:hypothetical protein